MKKTIAVLLCLIMILCSVPAFTASAEEPLAPNPEAYPDYCDPGYGALYAHATAGGDSSQTWQRWHKDVLGFNAEEDVRYFFLPKTADDNKIEIYNHYDEGSVTIGDTVIDSHTSAIIDYVEGEKIIAYRNKGTASERRYTFMVIKSDAEASVYVNDTSNSYKDYAGKIQTTDLWSFLIQNKENSVADSKCSIVDENGVQDLTLKKIKGRGNTNWKETDKKPFNLTFYDKTTIGDTTDKKFSFVSNAKDSTLLRNSIMYDLAYNVDSPYAPDQSFVDLYVNGVYRGSYIATRKIELGKNNVVSLKDESDDMDTGFNFLVEVDVWNYKSDVYFVSDKGYHVVMKTPDLDDYDESDPSMKAKYDYISNTYQKLEDALYEGTLEDIEKICDLDSLATQYLLQEFGKNCDGGYTSTFFTYNAAEEKFYAAPLWDCDSCLGAVDCIREGCSTSTIDHTGWTTKTALYERTVNPLGQAFYAKGVTSDGKTFEELCSEIWTERFIPQIDILLGKEEPAGKLKSIDDYAASIEKSTFINYVMWDFMWNCASKNDSINKKYSNDVEGEVEYLKDWVEGRADWITKQYGGEPIENKTIYFATDLDWDNIHYYIWGDGYVPMKWPGEPAVATEATYDEMPVYKAEFSDNVTKIIFNNGMNGEQTVDIAINGNQNLYYTSESSGKINEAGFDIYLVEAGLFEEPQETTVSSSEVIETTITETEILSTTSTIVTDATETTTVQTEATTGIHTETATDATERITEVTESNAYTEVTLTEAITDATEGTSSTSTSSSETSVITTIEATVASSSADSTESTVSSVVSPTETTSVSKEILTGDADSDGRISIKDTTVIQKHLAKLLILDEDALIIADTNFDGKVTISDATKIQKFVAQLIEKF